MINQDKPELFKNAHFVMNCPGLFNDGWILFFVTFNIFYLLFRSGSSLPCISIMTVVYSHMCSALKRYVMKVLSTLSPTISSPGPGTWLWKLILQGLYLFHSEQWDRFRQSYCPLMMWKCHIMLPTTGFKPSLSNFWPLDLSSVWFILI